MARANANKVDTQPIRLRPGQQGMLAGVASLLSRFTSLLESTTECGAGDVDGGSSRLSISRTGPGSLWPEGLECTGRRCQKAGAQNSQCRHLNSQ